IDFNLKIEALRAVTLNCGDLTLEPIKIAFSPAPNVLLRTLRRELTEATGNTQRHVCAMVGDPDDPVWCADAEKFVLFLLNTVLSGPITNFVRSWHLPNAVQLFDGVSLNPTYLAVQNGLLIVGGTVTSNAAGVSPIQAQIDTLIKEFERRASEELSGATEQRLKEWQLETSPTITWLTAVVSDLQEEVQHERLTKRRAERKQRRKKGADAASLALCSNDQLFDLLAKKYLSANKSWDGSASIDHIVKGDIGWWFRVDNATGHVITGGIEVTASVSIGGHIIISFVNLDPKHFGDWIDITIALSLEPLPDPPGFDIAG